MLGNVQIQSHRRLDGILQDLLIQDWQRSRQTADHGVDVGVGIISKSGGGSREDLAVSAQLHMGLQTDHGFPSTLSSHP
ncbi:MAG: Uncharacterised protein [Synechococcus sp. MIT S9220]|nr:MAG: Uncharacterised protein [Synechococcus sp. MIT S9220]